MRSVFKLWLLPKQKQRNKQQQKEKHTKQNNKQATPIVDKQKGKQGIGVEGRALHKALKLKYDLILKYLGDGIGVNQCISPFSSGGDSLPQLL